MDFFMFDTPLGYMALSAEDGAITRLYLPNAPTPRIAPRETPLLEKGRDQILEYLSGERKKFDLPIRLEEGTPFQKRVWTALQAVGWGETSTYREIAQAAQSPRAFRAVGMACRLNPVPILIPCHRILGTDGSLTGYAGGLEMKRALLALEGHEFPE